MTTIERICILYDRQVAILSKGVDTYLTIAEIDELDRIAESLASLWPRRWAELCGASEATRAYAEQTVRSNKQARGADARWK